MERHIFLILMAAAVILAEPIFHLPVYTECGGVVPINTVYPSSIQYKVSEVYNQNEFCVWTLLPHLNLQSIRLVGNQNYTGLDDGMVAFTWNESGLTSHKLPFADIDITFEPPITFLAFTTDNKSQLLGIDIQIIGYGSPGPTVQRAYHLREEEGNFTYPQNDNGGIQYGDNERVSIVVQGQTMGATRTKEMFLKDVDIEPWDDSIAVYTLFPRFVEQSEVLMGKFSGKHLGRIVNSTTQFVYPNVYLFSSDRKVAGAGFTIQWNNFP